MFTLFLGWVQSIVINVSLCLFVSRNLHVWTPPNFCACWLWSWFISALAASWYIMYFQFCGWCHAFQCFSALTMLVGQQKGQWWNADMIICLGQGADLHMAQLMPLPLTISCSSISRLVLPFWYRLTRVVLTRVVLNKIQRAVKWL